MAVQVKKRRRSRLGFLLWMPALLLALLAGGIWLLGPALIAPAQDFEQGPGGAVAYIGITRQLATQQAQLWNGKDVAVTVNETEFSGMLSSALLSGRAEHNPLRKVRANLQAGQMQVESVLSLDDPRVPERFRGPVGLELWLVPSVTPQGEVRFAITRAALGRIPVPVSLIQWAGRTLQVDTPGFDAAGPAIVLPLGDVVGSQIGRKVNLKQFRVANNQLTLVLNMATR